MTKYFLAALYAIIAVTFLDVFYIRYNAVMLNKIYDNEIYSEGDFALSAVYPKMKKTISGENDLQDISETFIGALQLINPRVEKKNIRFMLYVTETHIYVWNGTDWKTDTGEFGIPRTDTSDLSLVLNKHIGDYRNTITYDWVPTGSSATFFCMIEGLPIGEGYHICKTPYTGFIRIE